MSVFSERRARSRRSVRPEGLAIAVTGTLLAIAAGFATSRSSAVAVLGVGGVVLVAGAALGGRDFIVACTIAALPWMVVFNDFMPADLKTFTSAAATIAICAYVAPIRPRNSIVLWGMALFLGAILYGTAIAVSGAQFIQAAKYVVFPFMTLAVTSTHARGRLPRLLVPVLASSALAMVVQLGIIVMGLGSIGTYYGIGEHLGFDAHSPHELALMCVIIACGGLAASKRTTVRIAFLALGLIPALETGARSALVASALVILIFLINSRLRLRHVFVVGAVAAVIVGNAALAVVENRVTQDVRSGEFSSLSTAGSGRGAIWSVALRHYFASGPDGILLGTGLRSIGQFERQDLGETFVGHSDVIEVGVQLGVLGFAGWVTMWLVLLADATLSRIMLVPIVVYATINGAIESTAPLVVGMFLAAAAPTVAISDLLPHRKRNDAERDVLGSHPALADP